MDISLLREEIEKLVLLEEVAERRQKMIEEQKKAKPAPHAVLPEVESPVLPPLPGDE